MCRSAGVARDRLHVWAVGASFSGSSRFAVLCGGNEKALEDSGSSVRRIIRGPFGSLLSCVSRCSARISPTHMRKRHCVGLSNTVRQFQSDPNHFVSFHSLFDASRLSACVCAKSPSRLNSRPKRHWRRPSTKGMECHQRWWSNQGTYRMR